MVGGGGMKHIHFWNWEIIFLWFQIQQRANEQTSKHKSSEEKIKNINWRKLKCFFIFHFRSEMRKTTKKYGGVESSMRNWIGNLWVLLFLLFFIYSWEILKGSIFKIFSVFLLFLLVDRAKQKHKNVWKFLWNEFVIKFPKIIQLKNLFRKSQIIFSISLIIALNISLNSQ